MESYKEDHETTHGAKVFSEGEYSELVEKKKKILFIEFDGVEDNEKCKIYKTHCISFKIKNSIKPSYLFLKNYFDLKGILEIH